MKLHALDLHLAVAQSHDDAVGSGRGDFEARWQRLALDHQRMIAPGFETVFEPFKDSLPVVVNLRRFAMHEARRTHHTTAESLPDCLVSQTYSQQRNATGEMLDHHERHTGVVRRARPRRDQDFIRTKLRLGLFNRHLVVAANRDLLAKLAQVLNEVVSKRIVVVYYKDDDLHPFAS